MKLILPILFLSFSFFSQTKYIGEFSENDVTFVYDFNLYQHGNYIFVRDQNDKKVYSLNELTGTFSSIYNCVQNESILQYFDSKNGFCFVTRTYNSNGELRKIYLINEYGEINNLDQFQSSSSEYLTIFFVGDTLYEQTGSQGNFNLYKIVNGIKTLESTSNSVIWYLFEKNNKVFYYTAIDNIDYLCVKDGSTITNLGRVNSSGAYPFKKSETNDTNNLYLYTAETGGEWSLKKFNLETSALTNFFSENIKNLYFENDSIFYDNNKRYRIQGDTAVFEKTIEVKNELRSFRQNSSFETSFYTYFDAPTKNALYYSNQNGMEIMGVNTEDSLVIISNNKNGRVSSINQSYCSYSTAEFYPIKFTYKNKLFLVLSNIHDNKYYLYELKNDSLHSIFSFNELDINNLKFYPKEDALYFSTYDDVFRKVKIYNRKWNLSNEIAPINSTLFQSKTWCNEIGMDNLDYSCLQNGVGTQTYKLNVDKSLNSYSYYLHQSQASWYPNTYFYDRMNDTLISTIYPQSIVKHDEYGKLKWYKNIGYRYNSWSDYDQILLNHKGNPIVIGNFYQTGKFDEDSLTSLGSAIYFAELNNETGNTIQKKIIQESAFVNDLEIYDAKIDGNGNTYISFFYRNYSIQFLDTMLYSDWNLQNALMKLNENGEIVWVKNVILSTNDFMSVSSNIEIDETDELITILFYQKGYSYCEESSWNAEIIQFDKSGKILFQDKILEGNFSTGITKIKSIGHQKFMIKGIYRGEITAEIFKNTTILNSSCYQYENFQLIYDASQNRVISSLSSDNGDAFATSDIFQLNDTIYVLTEDQNLNLIVQLFDASGNFIGQKTISKLTGYSNIKFTVTDNHLLFFGNDLGYNSELNLITLLKNIRSLSILKIEKGNWEHPEYVLKPMDIYSLLQNQGQISVFPNPVEDFCEVNFNNIDFSPTSYILTDLSGRVIFQEQLKNQPFVRLNLTEQASGMYIFNLIGDIKKYSIKLVKI